MQTRPRPIFGTHDIPVFDGVEVNVIAQAEPIVFIPDAMLPVPRLPHAAPALPVPRDLFAAILERIQRFGVPPPLVRHG